MANTKTSTVLISGEKHYVIYFTLVSDGTQETAYVLYDSSVVCAALGKADTLNCVINGYKYVGQSAAGVIRLDFDATTDVLAIPFPLVNTNKVDFCFEREGGLKNYAGTGKTGDILLTTTGLASGDRLLLVLDVRAT